MTPFDCYILYLSIKRHFSSPDYDYAKYNGRVNASPKSFERRNDRYFFEKLSKIPDTKNFLIANLSENPKAWVKDIAYSEEAKAVYNRFIKRRQGLAYNFKSEIKLLDPIFDLNFFVPSNGGHPTLLTMFLAEKISIDTMVILSRLIKFEGYWDKQMNGDPVWGDVKRRMAKSSTFLDIDLERFRKIILDEWNQGGSRDNK